MLRVRCMRLWRPFCCGWQPGRGDHTALIFPFSPLLAKCLASDDRGPVPAASLLPVVTPQNAQVGPPDRGKAKELPCTRFYAS
jgi:hypothetical protein